MSKVPEKILPVDASQYPYYELPKEEAVYNKLAYKLNEIISYLESKENEAGHFHATYAGKPKLCYCKNGFGPYLKEKHE